MFGLFDKMPSISVPMVMAGLAQAGAFKDKRVEALGRKIMDAGKAGQPGIGPVETGDPSLLAARVEVGFERGDLEVTLRFREKPEITVDAPKLP